MGRVDRERLDWLNDESDRPDQIPTLPRRMLCQVYDGGHIPTTVPRVFLTHPVDLDGTECEGCSGTPNVDTSTSIPVVVIGPTAPVAGDYLIAVATGGRWVAGEGASSGGGFSACGCSGVPTNLTFTDSILGSCTLTRRGSPFFDWLGFLSISYPGATLGCGSCGAQSLSIGVIFDPSSCQVTISWNSNSSPPPCWSNASSLGGGTLGLGGTMAVTCSPFHATTAFTISSGNLCDIQLIYGSSTASVTWTITP